MALKLNGTDIVTNKLNDSNVSTERLDGYLVFPVVPVNHKWVLIYSGTSAPSVDLYTIESSEDESYWLSEVTATWPPNNYPIGTTGAVWNGNSNYNVYQVQEA